jgi:hypothetical protein
MLTRTLLLGASLTAGTLGVATAPALADAAAPTDPASRCETIKARAGSFRDDVAGRLGVTPEELEAAVRAEAQERVDAAIASGKVDADRVEQARTAVETCSPPAGGWRSLLPGRRGR